MNDNIDSNETIINLIDEIKFLNKFRKLLIISSIFLGVITFVYGLTLPKEYVSKVTFIPTDTNSASASSSALSGIAGLVGVTVSEGPTKKSIALAVLKSNIFLEEFADMNDITRYLFPEAWDKKNRKWKTEKPSGDSIGSKLRDLFSVSGSQYDIYELEFEWTDSLQTSSWSNLIISELNNHLRTQDIEEGQKTISYLINQLKINDVKSIDNVFFQVMEEQIKSNMLSNVKDDYIFKILDKATPAGDPSKPKLLQMFFVGTIIGLFLAIIFIYTRHRLFKKLGT